MNWRVSFGERPYYPLPSWLTVDPMLPGLIREKLVRLRDNNGIASTMWPTRRYVRKAASLNPVIAAFQTEKPEISKPDLTVTANEERRCAHSARMIVYGALVEGGGCSLEIV